MSDYIHDGGQRYPARTTPEQVERDSKEPPTPTDIVASLRRELDAHNRVAIETVSEPVEAGPHGEGERK